MTTPIPTHAVSELFIKIALILLSSVITLIGAWYWKKRDRLEINRRAVSDSLDANHDRIEALQIEVALLKLQMLPLWQRAQTAIVQDLTHPEPKFAEMDMLLHKLERLVITPEESDRFDVLLEERIVDPTISAEEQESAKLLQGIMHKAFKERVDAATTEHQNNIAAAAAEANKENQS